MQRIRLTDHCLSLYFSQHDTGHSDKQQCKKTHTFNFVDNDSDGLLVTVGDSWTWGADMTIDDDEQHRMQNHYGRIVSDHIGCDWLNLGQGGSGNFWAADKIKELTNIIPYLKYKNVTIVCTLTEVGRAVNTEIDRHIDYLNFFNTTPHTELLNFLNATVIDSITDSVKDYDFIRLLIGNNFVDHCGPTLCGITMDKTWLELITEKTNIEKCHIVSSSSFDRLHSLIDSVGDKEHYLLWISEIMDIATRRQKLLFNSSLIKRGHPNAAGHKLWANYIIEYLNNPIKQ